MNAEIAFFDTLSGTGQTQELLGVTPGMAGGSDYAAIGAFDGSDGLPPPGTVLTSLAEFEAYVTQLEAKTTQISADPIGAQLFGISTGYLLLGGTGDDVVTSDGTVTGDGLMVGRSGDDALQGGIGHNTLEGGAGADTLTSSGTGDKLVGGPGADHIDMAYFENFAAAHVGALGAGDLLDFSQAATNYGFSDFLAVTHFDDQAGEVVAVYHAHHDDTAFLFDIDGDGTADAKIIVRGGDYSDYAQVAGVTVAVPIAIHLDGHALVV
jgi:Ca2+-binding RTX toxin-like protein